jgi:hypothetical protein
MFLALSEHYRMTHEMNKRKASTIGAVERERLARRAYDVGCDVVQAVVDVCGTEARWTYLHDIVYGMQKLYLILGKPYLGATEGNEHAHQDMKKDFHMMCSHSNKSSGDMLQSMNLAFLRNAIVEQNWAFGPPTKETEGMFGRDVGRSEGKRVSKRHDDAIPVAEAYLLAVEGGEAAKRAKKAPFPPS